MNTQTGAAPRSRGEAEWIVVSTARLAGALALMLALAGPAAFAQAPEPDPGAVLRLLAQTQRAAADNPAEPSPAPASSDDPATPDAPAPSAPAPDSPAPPAPDSPAPPAPDSPAPPAPDAPARDAPQPDVRPPFPEGEGSRRPGGPGGPGGFGGRGGPGGFGPMAAPGEAGAAEGGLVQGPGGQVTLQFPLNPVSDLLNIYERLIGKTIIKDTTVFDGPQVSLVTPGEVPRGEAIRLIEATLLVNGYVIVAEPDVNSVKVLFGGQRQGGQSASFSEGIVVYSEQMPLPSGETLVGYFMGLDHISPEAAATLFGNHVVLNEFGRITPVTTPSGLLITESSGIIRQLIQLKQIIDVSAAEAPLMTDFIKLEYAEANVVAQIIQAAMDARMEERQRQGESGRTISGQRPATGQPQGQQPQGQQQQSQQQQQPVVVRGPDGQMVVRGGSGAASGIGTADMPAAQLIADDRLNRIMVVASPMDLAYIIDLIREFDQPLSTPDPYERPLSYVKANDILPVIVDVLQDTGTGQTLLPGGRLIDSRPTPVTSSQLTTLTGATSTATQQNRTAQATGAEVGGRADQIAFPIDDIAPISVLVGKTRLIADRQSNSIIVIGSRENQQIVLDIIDRLDRRPLQVYLATVIGELTLSDDTTFGVDYLQRYIHFNKDNPNAGGIASSLIAGRSDILGTASIPGNIADMRDNLITTPFGPAGGINVYGQIGESLDAIVTALETSQNFKVLSRPVVYTQNGKRAEITSGQEVPVPVESLSDANNSNNAAVRTSIEFKEVVLKLEVLPTINDANEVTLDIVQVNDRVIGEQLVADSLVPIIGKQELNTTVTIPDRSTIVLGGLITERDEVSDSGVPFFKDLPIVGHALKRTSSSKARTELMIFIQPIVVREHDQTIAASLDEDVRSRIGATAAAAFPEPGVPTALDAIGIPEPSMIDNRRSPLGRLADGIFGPGTRDSRATSRPVVLVPVDPPVEILIEAPPAAPAAAPPPPSRSPFPSFLRRKR